MSDQDKVECVGSLLVHSSDLQELSSTALASPECAELIEQRKLQVKPEHKAPKVSLRRRITEKMAGPAPKDEEADTWAD
eukprot:CAMPEP_0194214618 /NCGR_PEP_ID=MMETSP0156-20130528/15936_1 /TAXON_ID=33649 /ORGANISM="Thalassionema nitzschioides, Strain L26-B" /LENGTH=78 /DNA_ID=CAMNT_0038942919 /DNA_START=113 /DNA_END=349 /DNA_ORIENTATION=+